MPMLTTLRIALPGMSPSTRPIGPAPRSALIRSRTSCTSATTSTPSTTSEAPLGMRRATWSTDRFSDTLIRSPPEHRVAALPEARLLGEADEERQRLVGDPVLGVVEVEADRLERQALAATRVLGEEVAQMPGCRTGRDAVPGPSRRVGHGDCRPRLSPPGESRVPAMDGAIQATALAWLSILANRSLPRRRRTRRRRRTGAWPRAPPTSTPASAKAPGTRRRRHRRRASDPRPRRGRRRPRGWRRASCSR